jgi:hypothetical protein
MYSHWASMITLLVPIVNVLSVTVTPPKATFHSLNRIPSGGVPGVSVTGVPAVPEVCDALPPVTVTVYVDRGAASHTALMTTLLVPMVNVLPVKVTPPETTSHSLNCIPSAGVPTVNVTGVPNFAEDGVAVPPVTDTLYVGAFTVIVKSFVYCRLPIVTGLFLWVVVPSPS